ncbi:DNA cytosine methyltransferase|nr:DNA cytosine methyltransferase [Stenotrophomonas sp. SbOxS2]
MLPSPPPKLTVMDLFAGAGGLSEGFRQAGFQVIAGSDNDPDAMATYALNFPEAQVITGDIRQAAVKRKIMSAAKNASILVGGPPCQAFSQVRNHSRVIDDPRNELYREFVLVLGKSKPMAFVMENVTGMDQMGVREQIADDLSIGGQYVVRPQVLDAANFGVPQTRKRLIFIGILASLGVDPPILRGSGATDSITLGRFSGSRRPIYKIVTQQGIFSSLISCALSNSSDASIVSSSDAISDLTQLKVGNRVDCQPYSEFPEAATAYQRAMRQGAGEYLTNLQVPRSNRDTELRLQGIPPGGNHRDLEDALLERYITGQRWGQDNGTGRLSRRHFYAYRRLHPSIWAWTLNTKGDSVYHYDSARALSVREFARLQSFPDRFVFTTNPTKGVIAGRHQGGAAHSKYRQVGNAVPPLLAKAIADELRTILLADSHQRPITAIAS